MNNGQNKTTTIKHLTLALLSEVIEVIKGDGDDDTRVAWSAVAEAKQMSSRLDIVISRDMEVLILLLTKVKTEDILLHHQHGKPDKNISMQDVDQYIRVEVWKFLLPLHAMTGCDTT